jgi:multidrug efflux system outer membrane protein
VLRALQEVDDALSTLRQNQLRLVHLQTAASAAQRAAELAQQRYASGLIDFQTVLLTQRSVYGAQDSAVAQQATLSADRVRLVKALGGWPG